MRCTWILFSRLFLRSRSSCFKIASALVVVLVFALLGVQKLRRKSESDSLQHTDRRRQLLVGSVGPTAHSNSCKRLSRHWTPSTSCGRKNVRHLERCAQDLLLWHKQLQLCMINGSIEWRALVHYCSPSNQCFGLADRLRGSVFMLYAAALMGRAFFIYHIKPLPLELFIEPRHLPWILPQKLQDDLDKWPLQIFADRFKRDKGDRTSCKEAAERLFRAKEKAFVRITTNLQVNCIAPLAKKRLESLQIVEENAGQKPRATKKRLSAFVDFFGQHLATASRIAYVHLFQFRDEVKRAHLLWLEKANAVGLASSFECAVCFHLRHGGVGANVRAAEGLRAINNLGLNRCGMNFSTRIAQEAQCRRSVMHWPVMSDNPSALAKLKNFGSADGVHLVISHPTGKRLHVDKLPDDIAKWKQSEVREAVLQVFVDFYTLSRCRIIISSGGGHFNLQAGMFHDWPVGGHYLVKKDGMCVPAGCSYRRYCKDSSFDDQNRIMNT